MLAGGVVGLIGRSADDLHIVGLVFDHVRKTQRSAAVESGLDQLIGAFGVVENVAAPNDNALVALGSYRERVCITPLSLSVSMMFSKSFVERPKRLILSM